MVRNFPNSTDQPDEIALTIYLSGVSSANRAEKAWKLRIHSNGKEFSAVPFRWKKRSTRKVLHKFRTEFPENYLTIWVHTEISGFFGQMVSTLFIYLFIYLFLHNGSINT